MLGAPGSGKGTVGGLLSKKFEISHISSGEIFRSYVKKHDTLGEEIEKYISKGLLVPDELAIKIVEKRLSEPDVKNGLILDGYPRTKEQGIELDQRLSNINKPINIAINLVVSDDEIISRIVNRRSCPNISCREIYNLEFKKPIIENICDKCGSELEKRIDDNEKTVKQRLETYHESSKELLEYYKEKDILYSAKLNLHSGETAENVAEEIKNYLNKEGKN